MTTAIGVKVDFDPTWEKGFFTVDEARDEARYHGPGPEGLVAALADAASRCSNTQQVAVQAACVRRIVADLNGRVPFA